MRSSQLLLVFEVAGIRYALPASDVVEVLRAVAVIPLPKAPPAVEGAINMRGEVVPVLDVRAPFGLPPKDLTASDHLVVARTPRRRVALRADRALDLISVDEHAIDDARKVLPEAGHLRGVAKLEDGLVLIYDLATFLSEQEVAQLEAALA